VKVLIKIGGTLLDAPDSRARLAREIAEAVRDGLRAVVVHGGGKQMTRYLAERGIESRFIGGLRVTTAEVLDAVLKVYAGSVNCELVAAFTAAGLPAVGLTGMDGLIAEAELLSEELGFVGKPLRSNAKLLHLLVGDNYLPVIACVAGDHEGHFYNVNADRMAVASAASFGAEKLWFLTDVDGVRDATGGVRPLLTAADCSLLIGAGVATGGMQAKLEAAATALPHVPEIVIAPGAQAGIIAQLASGSQIGTRLMAESVEAHANG
jgi:acetylglutamate kinase